MTFLSNVLEKAILSQLVLDLVVNALAQCFSTLVLDALQHCTFCVSP